MAGDKDNRSKGARERGSNREASLRASLMDAVLKGTGKVAGSTLDLALDIATMSAMFGDSWLRNLLANGASPERLEAMAEAGHFLRDARETAGLSIAELAETLELSDGDVLEGVERGEAILPLEIMLRAASLLARHDPVPFLIKFLRSYNPQLEATLEQWGVMALPRNFERERRFVNLYRQHDFLRDLSDEEYQRFIEYMDASTQLVIQVMEREAAARTPTRKTKPRRSRAKSAAGSGKAGKTGTAKTRSRRSSAADKPVVRKVKPRSSGRSDD